MVGFGAAPALIVYEWALRSFAQSANRPGCSLHLYAACAAPASGAFNVQIGVIDKRFFNGLPVLPQPQFVAKLCTADGRSQH